jgi:hypothetical protein
MLERQTLFRPKRRKTLSALPVALIQEKRRLVGDKEGIKQLQLFLPPNFYQQHQPGRLRFASGRVRGKFSLFLSSKVSFGYISMSFLRGEIVLGIMKRFGCVDDQFMLGCQIDGK